MNKWDSVTGRLDSKPFMLMALLTRGDVSMLVNIEAIGDRHAELPDPAWLCDTVAVTFRHRDPGVSVDNESVSGEGRIAGELAHVHVPWAAVRHMVFPEDNMWLGWSGSGAVPRPVERPKFQVIDGDGSSATKSEVRTHLTAVE
jgi:hypothetical protein